MQNWDTASVLNWLREGSWNLSEEALRAFEIARVDGKRLMTLTETELKALGVMTMGDRRRITLEIKLARQEQERTIPAKGKYDKGPGNDTETPAGYGGLSESSDDDGANQSAATKPPKAKGKYDKGPGNYEYGGYDAASPAVALMDGYGGVSSSSTSDDDGGSNSVATKAPMQKDLNVSFQDAVESMTRSFVDFASGETKALPQFSSLGRSDASSLKSCEVVEQVARDFYSQATLYGRVIISEMSLPDNDKTLKPVQMGGTLGGKKFLVRGILFKFGETALFPQYADPWYVAQKIQGHEMKGLAAYFAHFFNSGRMGRVCFPMMAIIDYKGHRITAMSVLPINKRTLVYGSSDAGQECSVMMKNPEFTELIRSASAALGLKAHQVINGRSKGGSIEITSCIDLEGHEGTDGRMYLLDYSRAIPPAYKEPALRDRNDIMWMYYHMLRAEFVAQYQTPLSADVFSAFPAPQAVRQNKLNEEDVKAATLHLKTKVVQEVGQSFIQAANQVSPDRDLDAFPLTQVMHSFGLNMRYLGLLYDYLMQKRLYHRKLRNLYTSIQAEALMRVLKNRLRAEWRATDGTESSLLHVTAKTLNSFFGKETTTLWMEKNAYVGKELIRSFNFAEVSAKFVVKACQQETAVTRGNLVAKSVVSLKWAVLQSLCKAVGLSIRDMEEFTSDGNALRRFRSFEQRVIFHDSDFTFHERIKQLDVVDRARAMASFLRAETLDDVDASYKELLGAYHVLDSAIAANPRDSWLAWLMAEVAAAMWRILKTRPRPQEEEEQQRKIVDGLAERAKKYYPIAVREHEFLGPVYGFIAFLLVYGEPQEALVLIDSALQRPGLSETGKRRLNSLRPRLPVEVADPASSSSSSPLSGGAALFVAASEVATPAAPVISSEPQPMAKGLRAGAALLGKIRGNRTPETTPESSVIEEPISLKGSNKGASIPLRTGDGFMLEDSTVAVVVVAPDVAAPAPSTQPAPRGSSRRAGTPLLGRNRGNRTSESSVIEEQTSVKDDMPM